MPRSRAGMSEPGSLFVIASDKDVPDSEFYEKIDLKPMILSYKLGAIPAWQIHLDGDWSSPEVWNERLQTFLQENGD